MNNNWAGAAVDKNIDAYFEIFMPTSEVRRAMDKRDIQVFSGILELADYTWNLRSWDDGELLATQFFMVSSQGGAAKIYDDLMGKYELATNIVTSDDAAVYKHVEGEAYLYRYNDGSLTNWFVGLTAGWSKSLFQQLNEVSIQNLPLAISEGGRRNLAGRCD